MKIAFRVDASKVLGSGHVMRCLTLAEELSISHKVIFICSDMEGSLIDFIRENNFEVYEIPRMEMLSNNNISFQQYNWENDAYETHKILKNEFVDCLIIDHYLLDYRWEQVLYQDVKYIVVVDDLANRSHSCDILIDQNFYLKENKKYDLLVPKRTKLLLGEQYALLRNEFLIRQKESLTEINTIFVYFGASDLSNETSKVLEAYTSYKFKFSLKVLIGHSNPFKTEIKKRYQHREKIDILYMTNKVSELMLASDISIGAGGSTTWERCCIGLPSIIVIVADNQQIPMKELEQKGVVKILDEHSTSNYLKLLKSLENGPLDIWKDMQSKGMYLYDGLGKKRIKEMIEEMYKSEY